MISATPWARLLVIGLGLAVLGAALGFGAGVTVARRRAKPGGTPSGGACPGDRGADKPTRDAERPRRDAERLAISLYRNRRHAFLNHLQVISGWLQLGKVDRALAQIDLILREMEEESRFIQAADPSLVAYLLAKEEQARSRGIELTAAVDQRLVAAEEVAAAIEPALEVVFERLIGDSPLPGARLSLSLARDERAYRLTIEVSAGTSGENPGPVSSAARGWPAEPLEAIGARREGAGRWIVTWPADGT